jgi:hypothetical protein
MHIVTRPRPEVLTVEFKDHTYQVTMDSDGAFVPADLGEYMVAKGLVGKGCNPDPKPQWEMQGDAYGELIPRFARWVREVPPSDIDDTATPAAVAAILERKATK